MNQTTITTIIGAVATAIIAILQAMNHKMNYNYIGDLEKGTMHKDVIETHVQNFDEWQMDQDRRIEALEKTLMENPK